MIIRSCFLQLPSLLIALPILIRATFPKELRSSRQLGLSEAVMITDDIQSPGLSFFACRIIAAYSDPNWPPNMIEISHLL